MSFNYYDLPSDLQSYLASRFGSYGLDPALAYDSLLPFEIKSQGAEAIEEFMRISIFLIFIHKAITLRWRII